MQPVSIQSTLALLVAACMLPAILISAFLIYHDYRLQIDQQTHAAMITVHAVAAALDKEFASVESGLWVLSTSSRLAEGDLTGFHQRAKEVLAHQKVNNYVVIDLNGRQILNTLRADGAPLPEKGAPLVLQQALKMDATVLSDLFIGPVTHKPILAMSIPVLRDGKIVYSLSAGLLPERISQMLRLQQLPAGWTAGVIDSSGTLVARMPESEHFVGKKVAPEWVRAVRERSEGSFESMTPDGTPVFNVFSRLGTWKWAVGIGIPKAILTAGLKRSLWLLISSTVVLIMGGLALAWLLGGHITQAIQGLTAPALALGRGELVSVPRLRLKEANEVGQALVVASEMLCRVEHEAHHDALTGLFNRALFLQLLSRQLMISQRNGTELAVLYIDLDGFKEVNDIHGHATGDALLREVAMRLNDGMRSSDIAARFGGDEFVVLLATTGMTSAQTMAAKLIGILSAPYKLSAIEVRISASIGIATFPKSALSCESLLACADEALYAAKRSGKGRFTIAG